MGLDGTLVKMDPAEYLSEDDLQRLIATHPALLGSCTSATDERELLLIKREMGVPDRENGNDRWSMDHFFIDQACVPTLVEVKRSTDARIRREVVGQMLDYAANGVAYLPIEAVKSRFNAQWGAEAGERLEAFLDKAEMSEETFWQGVKTNLQAGKIRIVFVADELPAELKRIIEFLNEQMRFAEVLGLELRHFTDGKQRAIAPSVIGRTSQADATKGAGRTYEDLDQVVAEFRRMTNNKHQVTGVAHFRKIRLGTGIDTRIHFEFLRTVRNGITCEFHVETGPQPMLAQAMAAMAQTVPVVSESTLEYVNRGMNGALRVVPRDQSDSTVIARTMMELINATMPHLQQVVTALQ